jgi:tellurite resistance protein
VKQKGVLVTKSGEMRSGLFGKTPPAVFPAILGLLGFGLGLRKAAGLYGAELPVLASIAEAVLGAAVALWIFAFLALWVKYLRRFGALTDDMRVLPGRGGIAASTMGGMAVASALVPYAPSLALLVVIAALMLHLVLAIVLIRTLSALPPEARIVSPVMHLAFVGFIVGAVALAQLGQGGAAFAILALTLPVAGTIWVISVGQSVTAAPPAPLRPLLAVHAAPAALFSTVCSLLGQEAWAVGFACLALGLFMAVLFGIRAVTVAGFSPLWGAMTFPLAAVATALLHLTGRWTEVGIAVLALAALVIPAIGWQVLRLWPGGRLAARTNASSA